ncbi:MAG: UDP-N-acetylmuramate dehydrogenase [Syntrophomonadaceae bacterium]|nr:UDP-N-acetylmuramate dehydrogenase [Syntrophomonadaceae bacterium]
MEIKLVTSPELRAGLRDLPQVIAEARIAWNEPMSSYTSFQIGGPVDALVRPVDENELRRVLMYCRERELPVFIMGKGTNILVRDKGIRGVVIKVDHPMDRLEFLEGGQVKAGAGLTLKELSQAVAARGLKGLEFAIGIPGSLGGAVVMNAGAYNGEMKEVITQVRVLDYQGQIRNMSAAELGFGYRYSILQAMELVLLEATLQLSPGDPKEIYARMEDYTVRREARQPLNLPSAGSVFRRPAGHYVGPMIEELGLKGFRVNDAQVSEMHAGFIVNRGQATAADILALIRLIQERVRERFGVELIPEIKIIGEA